MPDADDIGDSIATNASAGVQSVTTDGNSATAMDIDKQLKAQAAIGQQGVSSVNQLFGNRTRLVAAPRQ